MSMFAPLMQTDPSSPRLTVYDDSRGVRMDFSAQTLDNWASKVANMLDEEFDAGDEVAIDLPVSWQAAVIAIGAYDSSRTPLIDASGAPAPDLIFTTLDGAARWNEVPDCVVVSDDPFGRGVVEAGGELPVGTVDFGPTVRFYGDDYFGTSPALSEFTVPGLDAQRYLVQDWHTTGEFAANVLGPIAAGGSVVVVTGLVSAERLQEIAEAEKVTRFIDGQ
ncbi:TIGR03089 family protein [Corynebacterium afermentans]|uniref:TIGR03089 family protein n=1 Tax=Corynebacterium afermentans TaxID=38286 RepID=UPI002573449B|nr:TIGR03089 family protein [Corynebacterium afermentans]MCG7290828.1 TIGR03089 family protein [Corynebacterium afermentans]